MFAWRVNKERVERDKERWGKGGGVGKNLEGGRGNGVSG